MVNNSLIYKLAELCFSGIIKSPGIDRLLKDAASVAIYIWSFEYVTDATISCSGFSCGFVRGVRTCMGGIGGIRNPTAGMWRCLLTDLVARSPGL